MSRLFAQSSVDVSAGPGGVMSGCFGGLWMQGLWRERCVYDRSASNEVVWEMDTVSSDGTL